MYRSLCIFKGNITINGRYSTSNVENEKEQRKGKFPRIYIYIYDRKGKKNIKHIWLRRKTAYMITSNEDLNRLLTSPRSGGR